MKKDIAEYVSKCLTFQQVKAEHQVLSSLLNPIPIPQWKWDNITMDFVFGFPLTQKKHDSVATPEPGPTRLADLDRNPGTPGRSHLSNLFIKYISFI